MGVGVSDSRFFPVSADWAAYQQGTTATPRSVAEKLREFVSPQDFGAVADGVNDDSTAMRAWLNCGAKLLVWPAGSYRVAGASAQSLSVATYAHGDATLKACLVVPAGVTILTAGEATQLIVDSPAADVCGLAIAEDTSGTPSTHSQTGTSIGRFTLRANAANGRYGIVTPSNANLLANKRPRYSLDVHYAPPPGSDNSTICAYGWDVGIMLGDTVDARVNYSGYGTYNATIADAGQHQMTGMKVNSVGAYGVSVRFQASNMRRFFDGGNGLEGFALTDFEGQGCWEGVVLSNAAGEPGGFIDAGHINTNRTGYKFTNRSSLQVGKIEAYRSDGYHNHGGAWEGVYMDNCGRVSIDSVHVNHGTLLTKTTSNGVYAANGSTFHCRAFNFTYLANGFRVDASPDCIVGDGVTNSVDTLNNLSGAGTVDFTGGALMVRAGTTAYFTTDGTVDKKRLRFPRDSGITVRTHQEITISAAGSTTVKMRETATEFDIIQSAGAGAFTYDLILDRAAAILGDVVRVKIFGSASANPTLRVCDNSTATVLSSFNSLGGTTRLIAEYRMNESGNWVERYVFTSSELTY